MKGGEDYTSVSINPESENLNKFDRLKNFPKTKQTENRKKLAFILFNDFQFTLFQDLEVFAFQVLNGAGDLIDLVKALNPASIPNWRAFTPAEARSYVQRTGMCSALIKVWFRIIKICKRLSKKLKSDVQMSL